MAKTVPDKPNDMIKDGILHFNSLNSYATQENSEPEHCNDSNSMSVHWWACKIISHSSFSSFFFHHHSLFLCSLSCNVSPTACVCVFFSIGMAPAVWLPPVCRPQNVCAALCSSHAVCYRCHAAPLRSQCHRDSGQQHYRVSHTSSRLPLKILRYETWSSGLSSWCLPSVLKIEQMENNPVSS